MEEETQTSEKVIKEGATSEEQTKADCASTLLSNSKTSDWNDHILEEPRQTCQKPTFQGEASKSLGKIDVGQEPEVDNLSNVSKSKLSGIESLLEPECRDEGGAPASGCICTI